MWLEMRRFYALSRAIRRNLIKPFALKAKDQLFLTGVDSSELDDYYKTTFNSNQRGGISVPRYRATTAEMIFY